MFHFLLSCAFGKDKVYCWFHCILCQVTRSLIHNLQSQQKTLCCSQQALQRPLIILPSPRGLRYESSRHLLCLSLLKGHISCNIFVGLWSVTVAWLRFEDLIAPHILHLLNSNSPVAFPWKIHKNNTWRKYNWKILCINWLTFCMWGRHWNHCFCTHDRNICIILI